MEDFEKHLRSFGFLAENPCLIFNDLEFVEKVIFRKCPDSRKSANHLRKWIFLRIMKINEYLCENPWFDQKIFVHLRSFSENRGNRVIPKGLIGLTRFPQKSYSAEKQAAAAQSIRTRIKTENNNCFHINFFLPPRIPLEQGLRHSHLHSLHLNHNAAAQSIRTRIKTPLLHYNSYPSHAAAQSIRTRIKTLMDAGREKESSGRCAIH